LEFQGHWFKVKVTAAESERLRAGLCSRRTQFCLAVVLTGKPVITYDDKYKSAVKLKAGSTLTISVDVVGSPTPKVSWLQVEEPVASSSVETKDNHSTLTVKNATSKHAGKITVKAENKVGADSAEFTVEIKGLI